MTSMLKQCLARVINNTEVAPMYHRLRLEAASIASTALAGQFVHVLPREHGLYDPLLRRAFSVLSCQETCFDILFRVQGRGTKRLASFQIGDMLDVLGPLGVPFDLSFSHEAASVAAKSTGAGSICETAAPQIVLVGGGVGVPPLAMLAAQIKKSQSANTAPRANPANERDPVVALIGARSRDDVLCLEDFEHCGTRVEVATDDGSLGRHGLVTQLLEAQLDDASSAMPVGAEVRDDHASMTDNSKNRQSLVYACGPLPMLRAVAAICAERAVPCQVSLEENMPCGIGVCNGCVVRVARADDEYGYYRRVCVDGPVMWAHEVAWDAL